jgi:putative SOS response-associated peptidase YedK
VASSFVSTRKAGAAIINAKAETVAEKPAYRAAFKARPCLVVADGFYEWAKVGPKEKRPYFITTKGRAPFSIASKVVALLISTLWSVTGWWPLGDRPEPAPHELRAGNALG